MKGGMVLKVIAVLVLAVAGFTGSARSEAVLADALKDARISGFASFGYNYDFNEPYSRAINFRPFNNKHDSFALELAQLIFKKDAVAPGESGFKIDLDFGYTVPSAIHSTGLTNTTDDFDLKQAYVSYVAPLGSGLKLDFGKFITEMGAEVIEGAEGWNWNYSRSLLFYFTIPFTHTGLRGTYVVNEKVTVIGMVINGWDNVHDNNGGKSFCAHLMLMPLPDTMLNLKYIGGPEQNNNNDNLRHVFDANLTTKVPGVEGLLFNLDYVYGSEEGATATGGDATWTGVAGILRYSATDKLALNLRAEYLDDQDGVRVLSGTAQKMWEVTFTPEYTVTDNMVVRAEYRHDASDKLVFDREGSTANSKNQDTVGLNVIYHF